MLIPGPKCLARLALSAAVLTANVWTSAAPAATSGPPYSAGGPLTEPRIFAEGVVSTPRNEFGGVFTPDGKELYFTRSVPRSYFYVICVSRFENGRWGEPQIAPFSGRYRDFDAVFSPDGSQLFFISDRPVVIGGRPKKDYDIWVVDRRGKGWGEPRHLGAPINTDADEWFTSVSANGTLYFCSGRSGAFDEYKGEIYRSRLVGGRYSEPEMLPRTVNGGTFTTEPYVAPDESFLLFSTYGREGGLGGFDIYVSYNRGGEWTEAKSLGPKVNTSTRDYSPRLTPDGKYLIFTSERNFSTLPLARPLSYPELERNLRHVLNGEGNIYQVELGAVAGGSSSAASAAGGGGDEGRVRRAPMSGSAHVFSRGE